MRKVVSKPEEISSLGEPVVINARPVNHEINFFEAKVDIVIPYHGQYDKLTNLIESIFKCTMTNYYRIVVVDDCSPNDTFINTISRNANRHHNGILKAIRCREQRGFAGACQVGFEKTENPYVCFINSDCLVEDINWLRNMGECLLNLKSKGVRMISPKTNNPVHADPESPQKGEKGRITEDIILEDGQYLSLYCFMCHRGLFERCGGFLKNYPYGFYEDEEFANRMRKNGFLQAVCGSAWIYHEGGCTVKSLMRKDPEIRKIMENENRDRCIEDIKKLKVSS